jgi:hypothetical protein
LFEKIVLKVIFIIFRSQPKKEIQTTQTYHYNKTKNSKLIDNKSLIKIIQAQEKSDIKNLQMSNQILSDLRNTKQTQTNYAETTENPKELDSQFSDIKQKSGDFIDLDQIDEIMSGSGLDFGQKVKSDYINSGLMPMDDNGNNYEKGDVKNQEVNARSGVYENSKILI